MKKKQKRERTEEHKQKLRDRYYERKRAEEAGVKLPTRREERAATRAKREPITEQAVNALIQDVPAQVSEETRVNVPEFYPTESSPNKRHPLRFHETHQGLQKVKQT